MKEEKVTVAEWNPADYIETQDDVIAHLECALEENDPEFILKTIGHIARSKGMAQIAGKLNVDSAGLYRSFSDGGNPSFKTVFMLLDTLGFCLKIERKVA
jgi:probable addiction module antidote protein